MLNLETLQALNGWLFKRVVLSRTRDFLMQHVPRITIYNTAASVEWRGLLMRYKLFFA